MIEYQQNLDLLRQYEQTDLFSVRVLALAESYGCDYNFARFYVQRTESGQVTAVLSYLDRDCTLSLTENADREELTAFFAAMGYGTLLCTADFCMDRSYREGPMMQSVRRYDVQSGMAVFDSYPKLMDLYNFIDYDSQDFESWYVDLSHRIRHGGAKALTLRMDGMILASGILSSVTDKGAVLTAVRTQPEFRRMGYGSMLVRRLVADCKGTVYLMREQGRNEQFYLQNGFINQGLWRQYQ